MRDGRRDKGGGLGYRKFGVEVWGLELELGLEWGGVFCSSEEMKMG